MNELLRLDWLIESDLFTLRRHGREIAAVAGLDHQDQVRVATALSEVGRDLLSHEPASVVFALRERPARLVVSVDSRRRPPAEDTGGLTGVAAARRLMDAVSVTDRGGRTVVVLEKHLPHGTPPVDLMAALRELLATAETATPMEELRTQNGELVRALDQLTQRQEDLVRLNDELQETNRGVLAMYGELSGELEETNRGVVALYAELDEKGQQLAAANEAKTRFLRSASHELRSPINSIVGLTQLLSDGPLDDEQRRQVDYLDASAHVLLNLVNELLDLARVESNTVEVHRVAVPLPPLLGDLQGTLRPLVSVRDVALVIEAPEVLMIRTDPDLLTRVLRNLLTNALSFTERGQVRIRVARRESGQHVEISVIDTGIGIAPEHHDRVFEEFFQVPGPLQTRRTGTGLGLPYARRVTEALGGTLSLSSALGAGSTFTVLLPIEVSPVAENTRAQDPLPDGALGHVLIVDDDEAFRHVLRGMLQGVAERVSEAGDGAEALNLARQSRPDLMLLDLRMPFLDGEAVLTRLRSDGDASLRRLPIVLMTSADTADDTDADTRRAVGAATALLPKSELNRGSLLRLLETIRTAGRSGEGGA